MSKFRKPSVSYSDVRRGAGTKKERAFRASVLARQSNAEARGTDEAEDDAKAAAPATPALTVVQSDGAAPDPVETDVPATDPPSVDIRVPEDTPSGKSDDEPKPEDVASGVSKAVEDTGDADTSDAKPRSRRKAPAPEKPREPDRQQGRKPADAGTVYMQGYIHCPLPGRFEAFDKLVETYGETKGLAAAITLGLKSLEDCITTGKPVDPVLNYSTKKERIRDRRMVDSAIVDWARENLDPADILKHYALTGRLWKTALGLYLAKV